MRRISRIALRITRSVLGLHPEVPANDGAVVLFVLLQGAQILFVVISFYAATTRETVRLAALPVALWAYLCLNGLYSAYTTVYHPAKERVAETSGGGFSDGLWRVGEQICATFVAIEGFLIPTLAAFGVWIRGDGTIEKGPPEAFTAASTGVGILAASSILKMIVAPSPRRLGHNTILLRLCAVASLLSGALLFNEFRGGAQVPMGMASLYGTILIAYGAHNVVFGLLCPDCSQRNPGHLIGLSFGILLLTILGLYFFGAGVALPGTLFEFLVVTALVMFVSSSARSLFTSRARLYLRQKNGHDIAIEPPS